MPEYKTHKRESRKLPARIALIAALSISLMILTGCASSIRYTREKPTPSQESITRPPQLPTDGRGRERRSAQKRLKETAESYLGVPYRWGGTTRAGFDCSGFVLTVYREVYDISLPRTSASMWRVGRKIPIHTARPGDLVFFKGNNFSGIGHVGIYMGNNRFIHSASSSGVIYSSLKETYYSRRFVGARRVL